MVRKIPRDNDNDYTREMAERRCDFVSDTTGTELVHLRSYSFEPSVLPGNIEHFSGVAQVPIGFAGPLLVHGEHAEGEFYVPMATTEGTLVASYNRGMKFMYEIGGVTTTVSDDAMQRAPVFVFDSAREARDFGFWIDDNFDRIRQQTESTTRTGKLKRIERYHVGKIMYLRFCFTTGDAAGQNMVGKATFIACRWILEHNRTVRRHLLSGNIDTDKKHSLLNTLSTRGKRVTAEVTIPSAVFESQMRTPASEAVRARMVSTIGSFMAGSSNNGLHSANGITALFIATGQDVANLAESSSALVFAELTDEGDYYFSVTIPSLIVATHGGGTGLPTQRECLSILGCTGPGKVNRLAEIVAATVLCGELSLAGAALAGDWVSSHDKYGRNR